MLEIGRTTRTTAWWILIAGLAGGATACGTTVTLVGNGSSSGSGASGAGGGGGSGSTTVSGSTGTGTTGNTCPPNMPTLGSACADDGLTCSYSGAECGSMVTCSSGQWEESAPPACMCPAAVPAEGSACDPCCTESCSYAGTGQCGPTATCSPSGTWNVVVPPCVELTCNEVTDPTACGQMSGCRWLEPGCGQANAFTAGCFDSADCTSSAGCDSGQSCVTVDTDPCWNATCGTCSGGMASICSGG